MRCKMSGEKMALLNAFFALQDNVPEVFWLTAFHGKAGFVALAAFVRDLDGNFHAGCDEFELPFLAGNGAPGAFFDDDLGAVKGFVFSGEYESRDFILRKSFAY